MATGWRILTASTLLALAPLAAACSSGAGSAGGNGEAQKSAAQIVKDAQQATGGATSVHISGQGTSGGQPVRLDIVAGRGRGGGTISESGETYQTVLDGDTVYLEADAQTWEKVANATVARLVAGKWIKTTTANQDFGAVAGLLDVSRFVSGFSNSGTVTKGNVTSVNGIEVVPVVNHGSDGGILYVAASGTPYIVALAATGSEQGTISFDHYNTAHFPPDPTGAIDLNALKGSSSP